MDLAKYLEIFVHEASRHLQDLDALLAAVPANGDIGRLREEILAKIHSIKGMAHTLELESIGQLCLALEARCRPPAPPMGHGIDALKGDLAEGIALLKKLVLQRGEMHPEADLTAYSRLIEQLNHPKPQASATEQDGMK